MTHLLKNPKHLTECKLQEINGKIQFYVTLTGNPSLYQIQSHLLNGKILVKSVKGKRTYTLNPDEMVWRSLTLLEILTDEDPDPVAFPGEVLQVKKPKEPKKEKGNTLLEILAGDDHEYIIEDIIFKSEQKQKNEHKNKD